ncbi:tRNA pseudouridine(38-40) synthase TruA [Vagococcus coleopterorum]|uniref:tRNA pseudouridine synthase A n=1 Tax=Vagococcus coleopterorum TaxID=2714946 RepID=A0A6G8ALW7_9ENTE|nr:tRNA pseudouridine(38-40) synthase TruA [Vagococcus coleopterorum]QIL45925.1 tRNA pseudouridine(38-40) synthase TruA [Vagococcus coleopterorum]
MARYKAVIAYDGTNYCGFQTQENGKTVQSELEKTLTKFNNGIHVPIQGSGRTDSGVHAEGQVIHFDMPNERDEEKLRHAFDTQSPADIAVKSVEMVDDEFHARYLAKGKTYHFYVDTKRPRSPFTRYYAAFFPYDLDIKKMQEAAKLLLGTHDFSGFCATGTEIEDKVRTVYQADVEEIEPGRLRFSFSGNGFLYKMVRIMVGTLLKIGNDRMEVENISKILETKDRNLAGPTAHPEGLYLMEVRYE